MHIYVLTLIRHQQSHYRLGQRLEHWKVKPHLKKHKNRTPDLENKNDTGNKCELVHRPIVSLEI